MSAHQEARQPASRAAAADAELKQRIRAGDPAALQDMLEMYWSPLVVYLTSLVSGRDAAEDVAQEALLRLWEHREDWSPAGSVRSLLYRIGRNLALNERRRMHIWARARPALGAQLSQRATPTPVDVLERSELRAALERALEQLPPRRREVFVLRQVHGLSVAETAQIMGISPQTVKNQMGSAAAELRLLLEPLL